MEIQIEPHTLERSEERDTSQEKIRDVLLTGFSISGKRSRLGKAKVYDFKQTRGGRYYEEKRVKVLHVIEENTIITVTVYVFYGKW